MKNTVDKLLTPPSLSSSNTDEPESNRRVPRRHGLNASGFALAPMASDLSSLDRDADESAGLPACMISSALAAAIHQNSQTLSPDAQAARQKYIAHEIENINRRRTIIDAADHVKPEQFHKPDYWGANFWARNDCGLNTLSKFGRAAKSALEAVPSTALRAAVRAGMESWLMSYATSRDEQLPDGSSGSGSAQLAQWAVHQLCEPGLPIHAAASLAVQKATPIFNYLDVYAITGVTMGMGAALGDYIGAVFRSSRKMGSGLKGMAEADVDKLVSQANPVVCLVPDEGSSESIEYIDTSISKNQTYVAIYHERVSQRNALLNRLKASQALSQGRGWAWMHPVVTLGLNFLKSRALQTWDSKPWVAALGALGASGSARFISGISIRMYYRYAGYRVPEDGDILNKKQVVVPLWVPVHQKPIDRSSQLNGNHHTMCHNQFLSDMAFNFKAHGRVYWTAGYSWKKEPAKILANIAWENTVKHLIFGYGVAGFLSNPTAYCLADAWSDLDYFKSVKKAVRAGVGSGAGDFLWDAANASFSALRKTPAVEAKEALTRMVDHVAVDTQETLHELNLNLMSCSPRLKNKFLQEGRDTIERLEKYTVLAGQSVETRVLETYFKAFIRGEGVYMIDASLLR
jgi:hypothetical protein